MCRGLLNKPLVVKKPLTFFKYSDKRKIRD